MTAQQNARDFLATLDRIDDLEMRITHLETLVNDLAGRLFRELDETR